MIREAGRDCVVVANKIDRREGSEGEQEAWALGFSEMYGVSAEHGTGVDDVQAAIGQRMPEAAPEEAETEARPREIALAVVGRPNVGKSSLVNALLGEERAIVSETAGTTRDSIDTALEAAGRRFRLVDTAGIRRRGRTEKGAEVLSVVQARKRIEECDVALLVVDAERGADRPGRQRCLPAPTRRARASSSWPTSGTSPASARSAPPKTSRPALATQIPFARQAPILLVSAKTGRGIARILETAARVADNRHAADLRRASSTAILGRALRDKAPRTTKGRMLKVFYVAQTGAAPPTFTLVADRARAAPLLGRAAHREPDPRGGGLRGLADPHPRSGALPRRRSPRARKVLPPQGEFGVD